MPKSYQDLRQKLLNLETRVLEGNEKAVERQHGDGKLTARERVLKLLDPGSFVEEFMLAEVLGGDAIPGSGHPSDGVVTGYGNIEGRGVYVFAQDRTVLNGTVGTVHGEKISYAIETARKLGVPVIGLYDSVGARIGGGLDVTRVIGRMFYETTVSSGVVPQISAIMGPCVGVASYCPALTDFIFMVKKTSQMFITGPPVIKEVTGEDVTPDQLGGWKVHSETSGVADFVSDNDEECLGQIPSPGAVPSTEQLGDGAAAAHGRSAGPNARRSRKYCSGGAETPLQHQGRDRALRGRRGIPGSEAEIRPQHGRRFRAARWTRGGDRRQPAEVHGRLSGRGFLRQGVPRFIRICDAYNLPIVTFVDMPGYLPGTRQEQQGIIRHGAKMLYAYAEATVPKLTLYLRKGYGGAKQAMCTREMGADQVFVWPGVELAVMGAEAAVNVLYRKEIAQAADPETLRKEKLEEYSERYSGPFEAVAKQFAQAPILPRETRVRLIRALEMFRGKKEIRPPRKHGIMPV